MDEDFQRRLDKIYEDHARFMALAESATPLTEQQKQKTGQAICGRRTATDSKARRNRPPSVAARPTCETVLTTGGNLPGIALEAARILNLARINWKANIELCKRIGSMMRQFRHYSKWLSQNATARKRLSSEALEPMNEMGDLVYSHVRAVQARKRVSGPGCIPTGELLNLERQLARLYRFHRNQWTLSTAQGSKQNAMRRK